MTPMMAKDHAIIGVIIGVLKVFGVPIVLYALALKTSTTLRARLQSFRPYYTIFFSLKKSPQFL